MLGKYYYRITSELITTDSKVDEYASTKYTFKERIDSISKLEDTSFDKNALATRK